MHFKQNTVNRMISKHLPHSLLTDSQWQARQNFSKHSDGDETDHSQENFECTNHLTHTMMLRKESCFCASDWTQIPLRISFVRS